MKQYITDWKLVGYHQNVPLLPRSMETGHVSPGVTGIIDAKVPGSIYADLLRAGMIEDPYYEMNSLKCEWVANRFWLYYTEFEVPKDHVGRLRLILKGVDDRCFILINNKVICEHEGLYEPIVVELTDLCPAGSKNSIKVMLQTAQDEMGQIGWTSRTHTQKARFNYKWDFCTRLVGIGIWDDVYLDFTGKGTISSRHGYFDGKNTYSDTLELENADGMTVRAELSFDGKSVGSSEAKVENGKAVLSVIVPSPKLWYPNGYGDQPLYDWKITLLDGEKVSDEQSAKVGLRTVKYSKCDGACESALPYMPIVNRKRIFLKGVNMTPLDMMYGCVGKDRYEKALKLAKQANVNIVRVWGGGVIEKEAFYELCDEYGIMVWQEFIQSSSGIDNIPSKIPSFLELLKKTAIAALKVKRNHVCLTYWSGGNELMDKDGIPSTFEDENIAMLKRLCEEYDPEILMLPTSASGPSEWDVPGKPEMNHDIHGLWKYEGATEHYTIFNNATCMLHSEFGCDGMTNMPMLEKYIAKENRDKIYTITNNLTWCHHGEWWDTYTDRDLGLFGEMNGDLALFVKVSQFMQGEALRYSIEAHRRRAWQCCGAIVWQFDEPWPNTACTNLVDYELNPKLAYYLFRDATKRYHVSMRYDKLVWESGETFTGKLFLHDDDEKNSNSKLRAVVYDCGGNKIAEGENDISFVIPDSCRYFTVECTAKDNENDRCDTNKYLFFVKREGLPDCEASAAAKYYDEYLGNEKAKN